jgi:hypothetical protein
MFKYFQFDVAQELKPGWDLEVIDFALSNINSKRIIPTHSTSRESSSDMEITTFVVGGRKISAELPWLFDYYQTLFPEYAQKCVDEPVFTAEDQRYALNINVQKGNIMRYECHVDTNPLQGMLYVTSHPEGDGGELVVANNGDVSGIENILDDCTMLHPQKGKLTFFDGRRHSHFVNSLNDPDAVRVAIAMNFYTPSSTESMRPPDLNKHLGIES